MGKKPARRVVFIDKKFQAAFALKFVGLLLLGTAIFDVAAYFILNRRLEDTLYSAHLAIKSVGEILLPTLVALSLIFIVLLGLAVLIMSLFVSHLIAGPLFAIRRYIEFIGEGRLDFEARLRSKDQTTPLVDALSKSLDVLNDHIVPLQSLSEELTGTAQRLQEGLDQAGGIPEGVRSEASRLADLGSKLKAEAGFFRTRPPKTPA
jgi:methyl-accepting chemotaxis protein